MSEITFADPNQMTIEVNYDWILSELEKRCIVPDEVKKALKDVEKEGKVWVIE